MTIEEYRQLIVAEATHDYYIYYKYHAQEQETCTYLFNLIDFYTARKDENALRLIKDLMDNFSRKRELDDQDGGPDRIFLLFTPKMHKQIKQLYNKEFNNKKTSMESKIDELLDRHDIDILEQVGFEESFIIDESDIDKEKVEQDIQNEFSHLNREVELELEEFYDDSVSNDSLQTYLEDKISLIYGADLEKYQLARAKEIVETYLENNEFVGVSSYKQLTAVIEDTIKIMRDNEKKAIERIEETLGEDGIKRLISGYQNTIASSELLANAYIATEAKKLFVDKNLLKSFLREKKKNAIKSAEKVLHYHRTSLENAEKILEMGALLNRANLKKAGVDTSKFLGSSSANVQFSVDKYDIDGKLYHEGFNVQDNLGASSSDVVFVFGPNLIDEETYDNFSLYPTVEKADIRECCATIMAKDDMVKEKLEKFLAENNYDIQVVLASEFNRENNITNMQEIEQEN